jgi:prepilin-type N-terminal cleavage/methylation domain-containing protein
VTAVQQERGLDSGITERRFGSEAAVRSRQCRGTGKCLAEAASRREGGFTLIELTVVLAVIVTLALVLTPSITNFINDSRVARTNTDTATLAAAVTQFYKDNGFFPQWSVANNGGPGLAANKVDLLISGGNVPAVATPNLWTTGTTDGIADQLIGNTPAYAMRSATSTFGWNGPYISNVIGADAWNNRYTINIGLIDTNLGTQTSAGATKSAVWVISAGANGQIETAYAQPMTTAAPSGDDIAVKVQ